MKRVALVGGVLLVVYSSLAYTTLLGYQGRKAIVTSQRQACAEDVKDRRSDILVRATQAWATQQVADDPRQPARTRHARSVEAAQDRASVRDRLGRIDDKAAMTLYERMPPEVADLLASLDRGRRLSCAREHPPASLLP